MGYFLVVDKKVLKYSDDFHKVLETMADMYGGRVSIEYYGLITKSEMLSMEYMDTHEGCCFFISSLELIDWDTGARRDISINIYHSGYLMEYVDDEDEDGYAIIEWLKANKENYYLDYSESGLKKYCVMVEESFEGSFDSLEEAYDYLKGHEVYGNLRVMNSNEGIRIKDTGLGCLRHDKGYHTIDFNVVADESVGGMEFDIAIIELDTVFNHFHWDNAKALAWYLDRDRSLYHLGIVDYHEALGKACEMLVKMSECKDCYEFQEKGCPFADALSVSCDGECHRVEEWLKYFREIRGD